MVTLRGRHSTTCIIEIRLFRFGYISEGLQSVALPVHCDLPVQLTGEGNPGDGAVVAVRVNTTKGHHTALRQVTTEESENLQIRNQLEKNCIVMVWHPIFPVLQIGCCKAVLTSSDTQRRDPGRPGPHSSCCQTQVWRRKQTGVGMPGPGYHQHPCTA